ncbi:hypothetical protein HZY93_05490 [Streptococcus danieliae]|uniref:Phage protein n=1 Tax=Streptococcus danieliae TaxID=747656 RepID=A0A7Z0LDD9_9STRE|nr:hypothetical protein [Streptococcus danieliae]MBF0717490.1 hypothetical protein [Streptococcus danieliae]NYS49420.1 hypothetical protein [Streptococcus danieliae]
MNLLSQEVETALKLELLTMVKEFLESYERKRNRKTGLVSQKELMEELGISYQTLTRWEKAGLKRYQPPFEDTRTVFYRESDILMFLGAER